jgi:hypothetical protein
MTRQLEVREKRIKGVNINLNLNPRPDWMAMAAMRGRNDDEKVTKESQTK